MPKAPYRCPPGPYERACQVAWYFKNAKPRSKVLILDANPDVTSKGALFKKVWAEQYRGIIEYRAQHKATAVDLAAQIAAFPQLCMRGDRLSALGQWSLDEDAAISAELVHEMMEWLVVEAKKLGLTLEEVERGLATHWKKLGGR